jgi:hypothetical protein
LTLKIIISVLVGLNFNNHLFDHFFRWDLSQNVKIRDVPYSLKSPRNSECKLAHIYGMYLVVTARKGISSYQLAKKLGITQKSSCTRWTFGFVVPKFLFKI